MTLGKRGGKCPLCPPLATPLTVLMRISLYHDIGDCRIESKSVYECLPH